MMTKTTYVFTKDSFPHWLSLADRHLEVANQFISASPGLAAFHFHQAAERYLKASLVRREINFDNRITNIEKLIAMCQAIDAEFPEFTDMAKAETLSRWETQYQYPPDAPEDPAHPTSDEFLAVSAICKRLREAAIGVNQL